MEILLLFAFIAFIYFVTKKGRNDTIGSTTASREAPIMGPFQIRTIKEKLDDNDKGDAPEVIRIEGKGLMPVSTKSKIAFVTSVLDNTDGTAKPVLSLVEQFQEEHTTCYQQIVEAGVAGPNEGYNSWVRVGVIIPDILLPPVGGNRKLKVALRVINLDNPPKISMGVGGKGHAGVHGIYVKNFEWHFDGKGYQEEAADTDEARGLAVKLAMSIAMADGSLDDKEGKTIQNWIEKIITPFSDARQEKLKELYNTALRESYEEAKAGGLSLSQITDHLNEISDTPQKFEAMELCFDVMAADGVADESELDTIKSIAQALELDFDEIEKMRDQRLIELNVSTEKQASIETIIGIESNWENDQIKKHLRDEYAKWNNRLNTLSEGQERDNAQHMLDVIAKARQKYA